ncbi:MAG: prepilin peptidase [Kofleriaceae bacterium]|nr:prepilin peptidase [Myxococcales bacterium]MCB9562161.1 prepilin peptidase [Kofleriaceae bacterium]
MPAEYDALARSPAGLIAAFVLGTLWGSFANVCIYRWPPSDQHPKGRSVVAPGSHCFVCGNPVRWYDNVPLLSYLWLRGRCRDCGTGFSPRYLLVEALTGALFALMWWYAVDVGALWDPLGGRLVRFVVLAAFATVLVIVTFIDLDHKLILDKLTYPAIPAFWGLGLLLPERHWYDGLIGAAVGYGVVRAIADGYWWLTKREGMGYGDGKLLAVIGALLGWQAVVVSLFGGAILGSVVGIAALAVGRRGAGPGEPAAEQATVPPPDAESGAAGEAASTEDEDDVDDDDGLGHAEVPFGPFLAAAALGYVVLEPWLQARFFAGL